MMMIASYMDDGASYTDNDVDHVCILHAATIYDAVLFGYRRTDKAILGVR